MSIEAMKLWLEALEQMYCCYANPKFISHKQQEAQIIEQTKDAMASLRQAIEQAQKQDRHELQAKGEHPAPCARFCEANAFQIEIRSLKAKLEQAQKQEPVAITITGKLGNIYSFTGDYSLKKGDKVYTSPPQRQPNAKDFEDYCQTLHPLWNTRISRTEAEGFFHAGWLAAHDITGEQK